MRITTIPCAKAPSQYYRLKVDQSIWEHLGDLIPLDALPKGAALLVVDHLNLRRVWPNLYLMDRDYLALRGRVCAFAHSPDRPIMFDDFDVLESLSDLEKKGLFPCFRCGILYYALEGASIYYCSGCHFDNRHREWVSYHG